MNERNGLFWLIVLGLLVLFVTKKAPPAPAPQPAPAPAPVPDTPEPVPQPKPKSFPKSYREAIDFSKISGDPVFLYFGASWCGPCGQMKTTTLQDPAVLEELKKYIVWSVDVDQDQQLARQYHVTGIPAYFTVDGNEQIQKQASGFKPVPDFLAWLLK